MAMVAVLLRASSISLFACCALVASIHLLFYVVIFSVVAFHLFQPISRVRANTFDPGMFSKCPIAKLPATTGDSSVEGRGRGYPPYHACTWDLLLPWDLLSAVLLCALVCCVPCNASL